MRTIEPSPIVLTMGHSTRTLEEFIVLLHAHGATRVVDVRTVPRSRHDPQFNKASLPHSLKKAGLSYVHLPGLGGLRHARHDSVNIGWRNASFRGCAHALCSGARLVKRPARQGTKEGQPSGQCLMTIVVMLVDAELNGQPDGIREAGNGLPESSEGEYTRG